MRYLNQILSTVKRESPTLFYIVIITLVLGLGCLIGLLVDDRTLMGVSVWLKPLKFSISTAIFTLTVGYLITFYPYSNRKKSIMRNVWAWAQFIDFLIIMIQGARGVKSHYNMSTPIDSLLYMLLGIFVAITVMVMIVFIFDTFRLKLKTTKTMQWAILLGWLVAFFASYVGGTMIGQLSHNVGVADGDAGLPLVNWSTIGGDLRVAHFFGMHGIQIIPLFAFWISKKWSLVSKRQIFLVTFFALLYALWIGFTFYQAKQGIPVI